MVEAPLSMPPPDTFWKTARIAANESTPACS
jgi:hypothetical protein